MDNKTEERLFNLFKEASGDVSDKAPGGAQAGDLDEAPRAEGQSHADSASEYTSSPAETASFEPGLDGGAGQSYHGTSGSASSSSSSSGGTRSNRSSG